MNFPRLGNIADLPLHNATDEYEYFSDQLAGNMELNSKLKAVLADGSQNLYKAYNLKPSVKLNTRFLLLLSCVLLLPDWSFARPKP
jgi:hypothetical protein